MKRHSIHLPGLAATATLAALAALATLTGCASKPDSYYTLAAPVDALGPVAEATPPLFIEVAPVAMPERLARAQMLVRKSGPGAEVRLMEDHLWTSSFENEMRDALAARIAGRLGAVDSTKGGRQTDQPVWRVAVQLRQFDAVEDTRVDAAFSWTLRRSDADRRLSCQWAASEKVAPGIDALAGGAQRVTTRAADAIALQLAALRTDPAAACLAGAG